MLLAVIFYLVFFLDDHDSNAPRMFISSPYLMQKSALSVQLLIIIKHVKYICHLKHMLKTKLFIFLQNIPSAFLTYVCSLHQQTHKPGLRNEESSLIFSLTLTAYPFSNPETVPVMASPYHQCRCPSQGQVGLLLVLQFL